MKPINIFLQGENVDDIAVLEAEPGETLAAALAKLDRKVADDEGLEIFIEDLPGSLDGETLLEELLPLTADDVGGARALRLHLSRCRKVVVTVRFNGETEDRKFPPSTTIERVRRWAALRAFGLSPRDSVEHVLQLPGGAERPDRDTHIGTLTDGKTCEVAFDLVPAKRVEG